TPLFQPLFQLKQRIHVRTELLRRTAAGAGIQIYPASGTEAFAVYPAEHLHRKSQQDLLTQDFTDGQLRTGKKSGLRVSFGQLNFLIFIEQQLVALSEEQVENFVDVLPCRLETSRTHHLNGGLQ